MYGTSTGSHCACAPWSAEVAGVARLFRVSRFIQALSAGFTPLAVPLPDACCFPLTSLRTCGPFRQLLHSLEGAQKRIALMCGNRIRSVRYRRLQPGLVSCLL